MRQIVIAKDIQMYFGKKESMSFKILSQIKKALGKQRHQPVTIAEFCQYYNVDAEGIIMSIKKNETTKDEEHTKIRAIKAENKISEAKVLAAKTQESTTYRFASPLPL